MIIMFFSHNLETKLPQKRDCVHLLVGTGQIVNQLYYLEVLNTSHGRKLSASGHSNHNRLNPQRTVSQNVLTKHPIPVLDHPPYFPDNAPTDLFLFSESRRSRRYMRIETDILQH